VGGEGIGTGIDLVSPDEEGAVARLVGQVLTVDLELEDGRCPVDPGKDPGQPSPAFPSP
jgi:hypothetical protein